VAAELVQTVDAVCVAVLVVIQYLDLLQQQVVAVAQHGTEQVGQQVLAGLVVVVFSLMQHLVQVIVQQ
jgi:predicted cation transporter